MTGPEHYLRAEEYLTNASEVSLDSDEERYALAAAAVHATLALVAAMGPVSDARAWIKAIGYTDAEEPS